VMMVTLRLRLPEKVWYVHRPMSSDPDLINRDVIFPRDMVRVPPGLYWLIISIELLDIIMEEWASNRVRAS